MPTTHWARSPPTWRCATWSGAGTSASPAARRPLLARGFDQLRALAGLTAETPLERTPSHAFVRRDGDSLLLLHDGGELRLPGHVAGELDEILAANGTFTAADLDGPLDDRWPPRAGAVPGARSGTPDRGLTDQRRDEVPRSAARPSRRR